MSSRFVVRWLACAGIVAAVGLPATPSWAQLDNIYLSGFVSQGYLNSTKNDYLIEGSEDGSAELNEAAVVLYALPEERLRVGIQLFARDFGQVGNNQVIVDWAFGDYRWRDELGFRAGKVRLPSGLYNEVRDVDIARDQVLLPQSVYDEQLRDFLLAYEGGSAYGHLGLGGWGSLDYEAWGGTFNVPDVSRGFWSRIFEELAVELEPSLEESVEIPDATVEIEYGGVLDSSVSFPWAFGGALFWEPPLEGLRVGVTGLRTKVEGEARLLYNIAILPTDAGEAPEIFRSDLPSRFDFDVDMHATASVEWTANQWTLASEYRYTEINDDTDDGWYVLASYQATDDVAVSTYYSESYADRNNREGTGLPIPPTAFHKDLSFGLRWDLTSHWRVKYEHHFVNGLQLAEGAGFPGADPGDFDRLWSYFLLKSTFHF